MLEFRGWLPGEHIEHGPADHLVAPEPLGARFAAPVPELNPVSPVDHVQTHRQAVNDQRGEPALFRDLPRPARHLERQILGQGDRIEERGQQVLQQGHHGRQHLGAVRIPLDLQDAEAEPGVDERHPLDQAGDCRELVEGVHVEVAARARDAGTERGARVPAPDTDRFDLQAVMERSRHRAQGVVRREPTVKNAGHAAEQFERGATESCRHGMT